MEDSTKSVFLDSPPEISVSLARSAESSKQDTIVITIKNGVKVCHFPIESADEAFSIANMIIQKTRVFKTNS